MLGPHTHTNRARDTRIAEPRPPPQGRGGLERGAPNTRQPSQQWEATTPGRPPTTPAARSPSQGIQDKGGSAGLPHPGTRAHSMWVADPDSPPTGRAAGGGGATEFRRPSQRRKAPPPGTPPRQPHSAQRRLARAHAVGPVLGPLTHTNRSREPWTGPRNPGCPPQGTGGRGMDSA